MGKINQVTFELFLHWFLLHTLSTIPHSICPLKWMFDRIQMSCNLKLMLIQMKNAIKTRTPVCLSVSLVIFIPEQSVNQTFCPVFKCVKFKLLNLGTNWPIITIKSFFFYSSKYHLSKHFWSDFWMNWQMFWASWI